MTIDEAIKHAKAVARRERFNFRLARTEVQQKLYIECAEEHEQLAEWLEELKEYKKLEEKGLLLKLPCKVGDIVYQITRDFISEYQIRNFKCYDNGNIFIDWKCIKGIYKNVMGFHIDDIGKKVFLTKEAAEEELKRLESAE